MLMAGTVAVARPSAEKCRTIASARDGPIPLAAGQFLDAGRLDALDRAELGQQRLALGVAEAGHAVERGDGHGLAALLPVEGNGEAVRLVADALQQVQSGEARGRITGKSLSGSQTSSSRLARPTT